MVPKMAISSQTQPAWRGLVTGTAEQGPYRRTSIKPLDNSSDVRSAETSGAREMFHTQAKGRILETAKQIHDFEQEGWIWRDTYVRNMP